MTNTIPNVPRELKPCPFCGGEPNLTAADYVHDDMTPMPVVECKSCSAWVKAGDWNRRAPSPAGVDGLEVVTVRVCGYAPGLGQVTVQLPDGEYRNWSRRLELGEQVQVSVNPPDAQAIIDGLRGEVERLDRESQNLSNQLGACSRDRNMFRTERDQQAKRIGELEWLLRDVAGMFRGPGIEGGPLTKLRRRIDAALSAGKEGE